MDFHAIIKSRFKKHWKTIACQIQAVNGVGNPKRGFLFDCGRVDCPAIVEMVEELKGAGVVTRDLMVVEVGGDVFILNPGKFCVGEEKIVVDVSGKLEKPRKVEELREIQAVLDEVSSQILKLADGGSSLKRLEIPDGFSIPTIFGFLINYPILYYLDSDSNCLSLVDLQISQVFSDETLLISFSVPSDILSNDPQTRQSIETFLSHFQNHETKTFTANHPTIVL
jgi:hypothetical protein